MESDIGGTAERYFDNMIISHNIIETVTTQLQSQMEQIRQLQDAMINTIEKKMVHDFFYKRMKTLFNLWVKTIINFYCDDYTCYQTIFFHLKLGRD